jgi:CheY-like chemotaxis protein
MSFRILYVDGDPHIRDIVELSLGLDPAFKVTSCGSIEDALVMSAVRPPDLILCDDVMPGMDCAAMLARLRKGGIEPKLPIIFLAAPAKTAQLEHLKSLGAAVITKPFAPMKLSHMVRDVLRSMKFAAAENGFVERLHADSALLSTFREMLRSDPASPVVLERLESCGHKLAGVAGVFGSEGVSDAASRVEQAIVEKRAGRGTAGNVETNLDALIKCTQRAMIKEAGDHETKAQLDASDIAEPAHRAPKLLIADDDPSIVKILGDRCASAGFEVQTAINGLQALIMARRSHPDILIIDVNMPELNGLDVSSRLFDPHNRAIDVVVMTGNANPETVERCESLGAFYALKGPDFWNSIGRALAEIVPDMAKRIKKLTIAPTGSEVRARPRVLIVDDDPDVEQFLSSRLRKRGVDTLYASNAVRGYHVACKERPSVIITDCFMPDGDAHYLLSRLRSTAATESIPVLVMSGRHIGELTEQMLTRAICGRPGAARIFRKSFETDDLFGAVQAFCGFEMNGPQIDRPRLEY